MKAVVLSELHLRELRTHPGEDAERSLKWLCQSLGFCGDRDKDDTSLAVFRVLLEAAREDRGLTSTEIAKKCNLSRGTVIHHINRFKKSGLVVHKGNIYMLRRSTLSQTLREIKKDTLKLINDMSEVATQLDSFYGLERKLILEK